VLDEAHNVEDEVRRWTAVEITDAQAGEMELDLPEQGGQDPADWLMNDFREAVRRKLATVGLRIKQKVDAGQVRSLKKLAEENDELDKRLCQLNRLEQKGGKLLVSFHDNPMKHTRHVRYQPTDVSELIEETLYSRATAVLLMSATLLDRKVFSASVGLPNAPYLSIPTSFKTESFGLILKPIGRMTRREIDRSIKDLPKAVRAILRANPKVKGIIHTTNYRITRALEDALGSERRLLFQRSAEDRANIIDRHRSSKDPTVIVSPSMIEGLSLDDDLSRFQVVCKVPYPDTSDPLVGEKSSEWYDWRTVRTLVQAIGRSVRSHDDWAKTYVLDLAFMDLMERANHMFPKHLREGITLEEIST
jgi:Rad3-related DNA helicase